MIRGYSDKGLSYGKNGPLLEPQIDVLKKSIFENTEKTRYYENIKFVSLLCKVNDFQKSKQIVDDFFGSNDQNLNLEPDIKMIPYFMFNPNDSYAKDYGTIHFDNFSLYIMNFVRLIAIQELFKQGKDYQYIVNNNSEVKNYCIDKINEIVPKSVKKWRNKVGAHYAAASPYDNDNVATIMESLNTFPEYAAPYYKVSHNTLSIGEEKSQLLDWSVTQQFDNLSYLWSEYELSPLLFKLYFPEYFS